MIETSLQQSIRTIRMCHGKVNAMDIEFCGALIAAFQDAAADPETRAIVLTGNGRVFSAGIDLKRWLAEGPEYVEPFMRKLEDSFATVFACPKPVVAAIDGAAIAGGCMVACAADRRLIATGATIGIPEMRIGVPLPMTAIEIVRFTAAHHAFQLITTQGKTYHGASAVENGLADAVVDGNRILAAATEAAVELAVAPSDAFSLTKRQIRAPVLRQIESNRQQLADEYWSIWKSPQTRATIKQYVLDRLS